MVKFNFVKTLNVTNNSIFYSFIVFKNEILGFGRRNILNVNERKIKHIKLDNKFNIIEDNNVIFMGEDPRCFEYNNSVFVLDNTYNDMYLLDFKLNCLFCILTVFITGFKYVYSIYFDSETYGS